MNKYEQEQIFETVIIALLAIFFTTLFLFATGVLK